MIRFVEAPSKRAGQSASPTVDLLGENDVTPKGKPQASQPAAETRKATKSRKGRKAA